jgi:hypothetical protein
LTRRVERDVFVNADFAEKRALGRMKSQKALVVSSAELSRFRSIGVSNDIPLDGRTGMTSRVPGRNFGRCADGRFSPS